MPTQAYAIPFALGHWAAAGRRAEAVPAEPLQACALARDHVE